MTAKQRTGFAEGPWSAGFCDCCCDCSTCCVTFWWPCITFGKIAEVVDRGSSSCCMSGLLYGLICGLTGCGWIYSCCYRTKMRKQYHLHGNECVDCLAHCCCEYCAFVKNTVSSRTGASTCPSDGMQTWRGRTAELRWEPPTWKAA